MGTDINQAALEKAKKGVYREWSMRQTSPEVRSRYFLSEYDTYRIRPEIQRLVTFQTDNLLAEQPPLLADRRVEFDLILCRNVLIYFSEQTGRQVIRLLTQAHYLQGIVYHEQGNNDKALDAFRKTLYADPNYVLAYVSQATVLEQMGGTGGPANL